MKKVDTFKVVLNVNPNLRPLPRLTNALMDAVADENKKIQDSEEAIKFCEFWHDMLQPCKNCMGTGEVGEQGQVCPNCGGKGIII